MMITTHNLKTPAAPVPAKLNQITTAIIPNAVPQPAPVGDNFAKLITTHDEPKAAPVEDKVEVKVGEPIDVAQEAAPASAPVPAKPRKPRKAKKG